MFQECLLKQAGELFDKDLFEESELYLLFIFNCNNLFLLYILELAGFARLSSILLKVSRKSFQTNLIWEGPTSTSFGSVDPTASPPTRCPVDMLAFERLSESSNLHYFF